MYMCNCSNITRRSKWETIDLCIKKMLTLSFIHSISLAFRVQLKFIKNENFSLLLQMKNFNHNANTSVSLSSKKKIANRFECVHKNYAIKQSPEYDAQRCNTNGSICGTCVQISEFIKDSTG